VTLRPLFQAMRPHHWSKNFLVFAGLIFAKHLFILEDLLKSLAAFAVFCLLSSGMYLLNDITDLDKDRAHPVKRQRPLPSGRLRVSTAATAAVSVTLAALAWGFYLNASFGLVALAYAILTVSYSVALKHLVIVDVLAIATGFVLRAVAGAVVIQVNISSWLLVCTIFLSLFLALSKRRHELVVLGDNSAQHRRSLTEYSPTLLDQMVAVVTAGSVMAYALYTTSEETIAKFGTRNLIFTVPFVLYGIFRYLYLVHQKEQGANPEITLFTDGPMLINVLLYVMVVAALIYF